MIYYLSFCNWRVEALGEPFLQKEGDWGLLFSQWYVNTSSTERRRFEAVVGAEEVIQEAQERRE